MHRARVFLSLTSFVGLCCWALWAESRRQLLEERLVVLETRARPQQSLFASDRQWVERLQRLEDMVRLPRSPGRNEPGGEGNPPGDDHEYANLRDEIDQLRSSLLDWQDASAEARGPAVGTGSNPGKVRWGAMQATGEPDTLTDGDHPTAWAPRQANGGAEWLEVEFGEEEIWARGVTIRETFHPGAISRVDVFSSDGAIHTVWEGVDPTVDSPGELSIAFGPMHVVALGIHLDTTRASGWNEIDAVGLWADNSIVWATRARASSSYAQHY